MAALDIKEIEALIEIFARSSLTELTLERGDARLTLKRDRAGESVAMALPTPPVSAGKASASETSVNPSPPIAPSGRETGAALAPMVPNGYAIKSPIVGTFYRRPSPETKPYVEVGSQVAQGDTLCVVEAMKVMNEIKTDRAGRVAQIVVTDGQHVEYGQTLMILDLAAQSPNS